VKEVIEGSHLEPSVICAVRYTLSSILLIPAIVGPGIRKINWALSFELGAWLWAAFQAQSRELLTESASEGSISLAVYIVLVPVVELLYGRKFTLKKGLALAVAVAGISLLAVGAP
jgi:drug/metabolite transporter (DMT)-like permease